MRQILVERVWDLSLEIGEYHIRKAFSALSKEFKGGKDYNGIKAAIWGKTNRAFEGMNAAEKDIVFVSIFEHLIPLDEDSMLGSFFHGGLHSLTDWQDIQNQDLLGKVRGAIRAYHGASNQDEMARDYRIRRKDLRSMFKGQNGMVLMLGPTGTGKTVAANRFNRLLNSGDSNCLFRANVGLGQGVDSLIGRHHLNGNRWEFEAGPLACFAKCESGRPILLIDEGTMIRNWGVFKSYLLDGYFLIQGNRGTPKKDALIYVTGNESLGGRYEGRYLGDTLRAGSLIMKRPDLSLDELIQFVILPQLESLDHQDLIVEISEKMHQLTLYLRNTLGVPSETFGTREIQDMLDLFLDRYPSSSSSDIRPDHSPLLLSTIFDCILPLLDDDSTRLFEAFLLGLFKQSVDFSINAGIEIMLERISCDRSLLKQGLVLPFNCSGYSSAGSIQHYFQDILEINFQCEAQWPQTLLKIQAAHKNGIKVMIQNADRIPSHLFESVSNNLLTEYSEGFKLILIASRDGALPKLFTPSLLSRCARVVSGNTRTVSLSSFEQTTSGVLLSQPDENSVIDEMVANVSISGPHPRNRRAVLSGFKQVGKGIGLGIGICVALPLSPFIALGYYIAKWHNRPVGRSVLSPHIPSVLRPGLDVDPDPDPVPNMSAFYPETLLHPSYARGGVMCFNPTTFQFEQDQSQHKTIDVPLLDSSNFLKSLLDVSVICPLELNLVGGTAYLPSSSPTQEILGYYYKKTASNAPPLLFQRNAKGLWRVSCKPLTSGTIQPILVVRKKNSSPGLWQAESVLKPDLNFESSGTLPPTFVQKIDSVLDSMSSTAIGVSIRDRIGIDPLDSDAEKVRKILNFVRGFTHFGGRSNFAPLYARLKQFFRGPQRTFYANFKKILREEKGVCRHRSRVAVVLMSYYGIQSDLEGSWVHSWVSAYFEDPLTGETASCHMETNVPTLISEFKDRSLSDRIPLGEFSSSFLNNVSLRNRPMLSLLSVTRMANKRAIQGRVLDIGSFRTTMDPGQWFQDLVFEQGELKRVMVEKGFPIALVRLFFSVGVEVDYIGDVSAYSGDILTLGMDDAGELIQQFLVLSQLIKLYKAISIEDLSAIIGERGLYPLSTLELSAIEAQWIFQDLINSRSPEIEFLRFTLSYFKNFVDDPKFACPILISVCAQNNIYSEIFDWVIRIVKPKDSNYFTPDTSGWLPLSSLFKYSHFQPTRFERYIQKTIEAMGDDWVKILDLEENAYFLFYYARKNLSVDFNTMLREKILERNDILERLKKGDILDRFDLRFNSDQAAPNSKHRFKRVITSSDC